MLVNLKKRCDFLGWINERIIPVGLSFILSLSPAFAWENGGKTRGKSSPKYGTHDWLAEEALKFLPLEERVWIDEHRNAFLLGTEAPDNKSVAVRVLGKRFANGYGDKVRHHNYYIEGGEEIRFDPISGRLCDSASRRAQEEYEKCISALVRGDYEAASFYAGTTTHYVSDLAIWAHVIGVSSIHESEDPLEHSEFEKSVEKTITYDPSTNSHTSLKFSPFIRFDGELQLTNAYDTSVELGRRTHLGDIYSCVEMQRLLPMGRRGNGDYVDCDNWSDPYIVEVGNSMSRAVNSIADILHSANVVAQTERTVASRSTPID